MRRATYLCCLSLALVSAAPALTAPDGGPIRVGDDKTCDYVSLYEAINDAPSGSLIEVAGGLEFQGSAVEPDSACRVVSKSLSILGGYSVNCDGTRNNQETVLSTSAEGQ